MHHLLKSVAATLPFLAALMVTPAHAETELEAYFMEVSLGVSDTITIEEQKQLSEWMGMHNNRYSAVRAEPFYQLSPTLATKEVKFWKDGNLVREVAFALYGEGETFAPYFTEVKDCEPLEGSSAEPPRSIILVDGQRIQVALVCESFGSGQTKQATIMVTQAGRDFVLRRFQEGALVFVSFGGFDTVPFSTYGFAEALESVSKPAL
jgi:hypothetical protein